ncbi:MAG: hypothetical protein AAFQ36_10045 [Pseudomonadota bacterium]
MADPFYIRAADWLGNACLRAVHLVLRPLPYAQRVHLGGWLGRTVLPRVPMARRRTEANLDKVLPQMSAAERKALIRGVADNFGRVFVEEGMMERFVGDPSRFHPQGPGWDGYRALVEGGAKPIVVTAHYGNWEGIRTLSRDIGCPLAAVYRPHNNPYYNADFAASLRPLSPINFPKGSEGTRQLLSHVRGGGAVFILIDQKQTGAPLVPFLGVPAETTLTAAKLSKSDANPLIPAISRRRADGVSFDVFFGAPIAEGSAEARMRAANDQLSEWISEVPEQWFWFHRRWR